MIKRKEGNRSLVCDCSSFSLPFIPSPTASSSVLLLLSVIPLFKEERRRKGKKKKKEMKTERK